MGTDKGVTPLFCFRAHLKKKAVKVAKEEIERFKGQLVKCVYHDGDHVTVVRGRLVSVSNDFAEIHTHDNVFLIRLSEIVKLQRGLTAGDGHE